MEKKSQSPTVKEITWLFLGGAGAGLIVFMLFGNLASTSLLVGNVSKHSFLWFISRSVSAKFREDFRCFVR